jgi:hypothetical protein
MRKVTQIIANALRQGINKKIGNTSTINGEVFLHGNKIAKIEDGALLMTLADWNTQTTRERLNGIADAFGSKERFRKRGDCAFIVSPWGEREVKQDAWYCVGYV